MLHRPQVGVCTCVCARHGVDPKGVLKPLHCTEECLISVQSVCVQEVMKLWRPKNSTDSPIMSDVWNRFSNYCVSAESLEIWKRLGRFMDWDDKR